MLRAAADLQTDLVHRAMLAEGTFLVTDFWPPRTQKINPVMNAGLDILLKFIFYDNPLLKKGYLQPPCFDYFTNDYLVQLSYN